jgi:serine/threonine-protein kinase
MDCGDSIGSYRLVRHIGQGAMGNVYEAEHLLLGSHAAIKVLRPELSLREETVSRFFNEARAAAAARHPGLVEVYDFGYHESGNAYLVMELLEGDTLSSLLARRGPLPAGEAVLLARQVAMAMGAAHHCGVIHRDLKPDNLFITSDPGSSGGLRVKVLDFGVAKLASAGVAGATATRTGQLIGTPLYMAPEQCHGASLVDARADIYSLGCILYHATCGHPPFCSEGAGPVIAAHLYEPPTPPSQIIPSIPPRVEALCLRLLEKAPELRPQTMGEVEELLVASISAVSHVVVGVDSGRIVDPTSATAPVTLPLQPLRWNAGLWWGGAASLAGLVALVVVMNPVSTPKAVAVASLPMAKASAPVSVPVSAVPRLVTLRVESRPLEAEVVRASDGALLGKTPLSLIVPEAEGATTLRVRKPGYRTEDLQLSTAKDAQVSVVLLRRPASPRSAAPGKAYPKMSVKDGALDPFGD